MSKSAREDRPWKYTGTFLYGSPVSQSEIQEQIVEGCTCYGCEANRRWLKQLNETKEHKE